MNTLKRRVMFFALALTASTFAAPSVTDVTAKQRYPWNGLVDITCKVTGISGSYDGRFEVAAVIPNSANATPVSRFWVVRNGQKSTDVSVSENGNYRLLWDLQSDLGAVKYSNMVVRIIVKGCTKVQLWEGGPYWATANIGAEEPHEYGYYFWWGDTIGYKRENDAWVASDGSVTNFSFRGIPSTPNISDGALTLEYDAAHVHWGGNWRMPTKAELENLESKCSWIWTTMNGVNGYIVRGKDAYDSASIFLPASGLAYGTSFDSDGTVGCYWSSVLDLDPLLPHSYSLSFNPGSHLVNNYSSHDYGQSVRAVQGFTE